MLLRWSTGASPLSDARARSPTCSADWAGWPQTTAYPARVMSTQQPPVRIINVGRCYRAEQTDATHEWMFCQVDGLAVDEGLTLGDLRGTLTTFAQRMFSPTIRTRFRCDYFPF